MPKSGLNVALKGLDDLFSSEETRQEEQREQVQQIPVDELFPFKNHPFKVLDDDAMTRTVESISQFGVLAPLIARPRPEGGYEIISGHRRKHAAELAHLDTVPVIVRNMEDDAATILMVDSNLQREHILPSERAFAYKMKLDAIKNQGARSDLTSSQVGTKLRADEKVAKDSGESRNQVQRFVRLTNLAPELLDMVDEKKISFNPAVELSYLDAFIVATHTDREHIHNHIIYNSTALDSTRKFRDFLLSGLAVQRLSDLICLEHQLSVIEIKPYRERQKRTLYPPKESNRDRLCGVIDTILAEKPKDYEDFLQGLEQQGYEVKRGKYTSVKGARQKRFIRFRTLGAGYSEEELKAVISGEAEHHPRQKQKRIVPEQKFQMLVDIQAKLAEGKSMGYARWAKRYNLKEMSKTLIFLQENKIGSIEEMQERIDAATARYHELGDSIKAAETRMAEIAVLRTHIVNYARTRPVYDAYRKAGYSKSFLDTHREEITLHKAAKTAFDEAGLKKLPKAKDLSIEYAELLKKKKESYPDYRKARDEMQELMKAQKNVEMFFAEEKDTAEKEPTR